MKKKTASKTGKLWLEREMGYYRSSVLFLAVLIAFSTLFSLLFAYMVRFLINSATEGDADKLWVFAFVLLGLLLLRILLKTFSGFISEKLRAKITANLRIKIFSKILRSDYALVQKYHSGDMLNRLTSDVQEVVADTVGLLPTAVGMIVQCIGAIAALMTIDYIFTIVYVVCGVILGGIITLFRRQVKKMHKDVLESDGKFRSFMQEALSSIMTLKAYSAEMKTTYKAETFAEQYYKKRMKRNTLHSFMNAVFSTLSNFGLILAVVWCGISVLNGNDDYGSILSVILLLMQLQQPLSSFSSLIPAYYARIASGERLAEIDNLPMEIPLASSKNADVCYKNIQSIDLQNLSFTYGREIIFNDTNYTLEKGKIICLTGASGVGKSTIFKLLLSVFKPTNGGIYLKKQAEEENQILLTEAYRNLFAYVPQGHFLFSGTIYENIAFFSNETQKDTLNEKIREALKTSCAEFVWDFPEGLDTILTEGGGGLSEGQLQRLAIARALLSERPILLLDEATSALDNETEQTLLKNIRSLKNKTCLIVTHRPAALEIADGIIHIENGKITSIKNND